MGKSFDIFISYSRNDYSRVEEIVAHLVDNGFTVWIDKDGIESGDAFKSVIVSAIEESNLFLFVSSQYSNLSEWTVKEVNTAIYKKKHIIPVKLDNTEYNASILFDLVGLDYIDMTNPEMKNEMMSRLLRSVSKNFENRCIDSSVNVPDSKQPLLRTAKFFSDKFHPIVNTYIAFQLFAFILVLLMLLWTFFTGCLAFYHHPQVSHVVLILSLAGSLFATLKISTYKSYWIGAIFILDIIEVYLVSHLGEFLYDNWGKFSDVDYPSTIRYQLLFSIGKSLEYHSVMGVHQYLLYLVIVHIILTCSLFFVRKEGQSVWSLMRV